MVSLLLGHVTSCRVHTLTLLGSCHHVQISTLKYALSKATSSHCRFHAFASKVPGALKGVSRYAIKKSLAITGDVQVKAVNAILKKAVDQGKLIQTDQSFKLPVIKSVQTAAKSGQTPKKTVSSMPSHNQI